MELKDKKVRDLLKDWILFRDESLSRLTEKNKKHLINFDRYADNILRNVSDSNKKYVRKQLEKLDDYYLDYFGYQNAKYYKLGFSVS